MKKNKIKKIKKVKLPFDKMSGLDKIKLEVVSIRSEIEMLKNLLTKKVDIDYVKRLEIRLVRVEKRLKLSAL